MAKRILLVLAGVFLVIQFIRPAPNAGPSSPGPGDLLVRFPPPADVRHVLETACYDCHSNQTHYPWYAQVQPVGWWLASHINDGKRALNFSEFASYSPTKQARKLNQISDQVTERSMPLPSYTWIHRSARLTDAQISAISDWADGASDQLAPGGAK
jgi:hypothetical protein